MNVRPIRNDEDHSWAVDEIDRLWNAEPGTPEHDALDILTTLVDAYEAKHHAIAPPDPIAAIEFRMEQLGLTRKSIEVYLGHRGRVSEVLSGQRPLTITMIRKLHAGLGLPAEVLIAGPA